MEWRKEMNKYMEIKKDSRLYNDYFIWLKEKPEVIAVFERLRAEYGIESEQFYLSKEYLKIIPTKQDEEKFREMLKKTSPGEFKKYSSISKKWREAVKDINHIHRPRLLWYFDILGYQWKERIFHVEDRLYCSIESEGKIVVPNFAKEMKASEFYQELESIQNQNPEGKDPR